MKHVRLFEQFINSVVDLNVQRKMSKKYETWERGVIKAWGGVLYMEFHDMENTGTTQDIKTLKKEFKFFHGLKYNTDEYDDYDEWFQDGGQDGGIPLFNKSTLNKIFVDISKKTPAPYDFVIYRTSNKEQPGINSYTTSNNRYEHYDGITRSYIIKKGTPIIFAGIDADDDEIIWIPSNKDLKLNKIK